MLMEKFNISACEAALIVSNWNSLHRCTAWVSFDGKQRQELNHGDFVRVRMSPNPVPTVDRQDQTIDWFASLERCFRWNDRGAEQGPLETPHIYGTIKN